MESTTKFGIDNRGTKACTHCGVLSWASRQNETANRAMCQGCYDSAGYENEHEDGYHSDRPETLCPICNPAGEEKRLARAAARVASYGAAAALRSEKAAAKEATYPHCPTCSQRRPKTKTWEKTGVAADCSDCKSDKDWIAFYTNDVPSTADRAMYERSLAARVARYNKGS